MASSDWPQSRKEKEIRLVNLFQYGLADSEAQRRSLDSQVARLQRQVAHTSLRAYTPLPPPRGRSTGQTPSPSPRAAPQRHGTPPRPVTMPPFWPVRAPRTSSASLRSAATISSRWTSLSPRSVSPSPCVMMHSLPYGMMAPMHNQRLHTPAAQRQDHGGLGRAAVAAAMVLAAVALLAALWPQPRVLVSDTQLAVLTWHHKDFETERPQYTVVPLAGKSSRSKTADSANVGSSDADAHAPSSISSSHAANSAAERPGGTFKMWDSNRIDSSPMLIPSINAERSVSSHADIGPSANKIPGRPFGDAHASAISPDSTSSEYGFVTVIDEDLDIEAPPTAWSVNDNLHTATPLLRSDAHSAEGSPQSQPLLIALACFFSVSCLAAAPHCSSEADHEAPAEERTPAVAIEGVGSVEEMASPLSAPTGIKSRHRLPLHPISLQQHVPDDVTAKKAECCETPKKSRDGKHFSHVLMVSPYGIDAHVGDAKLPRSRRCRTATPEPAEVYKVRKMYLASVGKKGTSIEEEPPQPYPFKSPRLREEAEREVVRMVAAAAEAEEAAIDRIRTSGLR